MKYFYFNLCYKNNFRRSDRIQIRPFFETKRDKKSFGIIKRHNLLHNYWDIVYIYCFVLKQNALRTRDCDQKLKFYIPFRFFVEKKCIAVIEFPISLHVRACYIDQPFDKKTMGTVCTRANSHNTRQSPPPPSKKTHSY